MNKNQNKIRLSLQQDIDREVIEPDHLDIGSNFEDYKNVTFKPMSKMDTLYRWYVAFCHSHRALDSVLEAVHAETSQADLKIGVYLKDESEFVDLQVWCNINGIDADTLTNIPINRTRHVLFRALFDRRIEVIKVKTIALNNDT